MIKRDREYIDLENLDEKIIMSCILEYKKDLERLNKLDNYYIGNHKITERENKGDFAPNNKLINNYAKYITDTACGYFLGNEISYNDEKDSNIENLLEIFKKTDSATHDSELEKDLSVFGKGYELIYMSDEKNTITKLALIDPRNVFVVYDTSVEEKSLFGCMIRKKYTSTGEQHGEYIDIYTDTYIFNYETDENEKGLSLIKRVEHYFKEVPIIKYKNNEEEVGDFEGIISLIDAYNVLQSDRLNDKERFVDAILVVINAYLDSENVKDLKISRMMELPENSDAKYLTKLLNETETQILSNSIKDDIHKFSQTPDFTDENFSGNNSGVAMAYKLLSLENLAKVKERFFISGVRKRLSIINNILEIQGKSLNLDTIKITMNRTLPVNDLELAQITQMLTGIVSQETLLSRLHFVEDIQQELSRINKEKKASEDLFLNKFTLNNKVDNQDI